MSVETPTAPPTYRNVLLRWSRGRTFGACVAVAALLLALVVQVSLLNGWHTPLDSDRIVLGATGNAAPVPNAPGEYLYNFAGQAVVSATSSLDIGADSVLGVEFVMDAIPNNTALTLGWSNSRDRRKPNSVQINLPASVKPKRVFIQVRGHPQWRERLAQVAVALAAPSGSEPVTVSDVRFIESTPTDTLSLASRVWTSHTTQLRAPQASERVLPLWAWVSFAAAIATLVIAWVRRRDLAARREAILGAAFVFFGASLVATSYSPRAFVIGQSTIAWWFAAASILAALALVGAKEANPFRGNTRLVVALGVSIVATVALGHLQFLWIVPVVACLLMAKRFAPQFSKLQAALFFAPVLAMGGAAQWLASRQFKLGETTLADPTNTLSNTLASSSALPALASVLLLGYAAWSSRGASSRTRGGGLAFWLALIGVIAMCAMQTLAVSVPTRTGAAWIIAPLLIALAGWLAPSLLSPVTQNEVSVVPTKTEADLSDAARRLFDGAAASFDSALASERTGSALAPLNRLKQIAPDSLVTRAAELRYALKNTELTPAADAYATLKYVAPDRLPVHAAEAILEYALRHNDYATVVERGKMLPINETNARMVARAQLLGTKDLAVARADALQTLLSVEKPNSLAIEIAELHLLGDDWKAAQTALIHSGFSPQSIPGQVYVARLGMRAASVAQYADQIQKLATWNNTLGIAQIAMGELQLAQGNRDGARARFILAHRIDPALFTIDRRLADLADADHRTSDAETEPLAITPSGS
jgi:hypothetical protein